MKLHDLKIGLQALQELRCRFAERGCRGAVVGVYSVPEGCACWPDPVQALCAQHLITAESSGDVTALIYREETAPPGATAGIERRSET